MASQGELEFFAATDVGRKRSHNEDNFLVDRDLGLFVVADGMGGHAAGEVASAITVRTIHEVLTGAKEVLAERAAGRGTGSERGMQQILGLLEFAVNSASERVHAEGAKDTKLRGMGTTVCALLVLGGHAFVGHVGDSRIYLERNGEVRQVTEDHTVARELLRLGMVTKDQLATVPRKNAITRAVGVYAHVEVDTMSFEVLPGDKFLLCSDGLAGYFDDTGKPIAPFLDVADGEAAVKGLIDFANDSGGKDNVTAVLVRVGGGDDERARRIALKRDVLAGLPLFAKLNERQLMSVMAVADVTKFEAGHVLLREGDPGDAMYVILAGKLEVQKNGTAIGTLGVGDQLGEMALIRTNPRSATVVVRDPSELVCIRRGDFFDILRGDPHGAVKLLWQFINVLADRLERTSQELSDARRARGSTEPVDAAARSALLPTAPPEDPFAAPAAKTTLALRSWTRSGALRDLDAGLRAEAASEVATPRRVGSDTPPPPLEPPGTAPEREPARVPRGAPTKEATFQGFAAPPLAERRSMSAAPTAPSEDLISTRPPPSSRGGEPPFGRDSERPEVRAERQTNPGTPGARRRQQAANAVADARIRAETLKATEPPPLPARRESPPIAVETAPPAEPGATPSAGRSTVRLEEDAPAGFRPTKETVRLDESASLGASLEEMRRAFRERLAAERAREAEGKDPNKRGR